MAITYHAGRRIQATQADFDGTPAVSGGWKELARTTLGSAGDTINVTGLADKRYLMILKSFSGSTSGHDRFNGDRGSNYAGRYHASGTDYPLTNRTAYPWHNAGYSSTPNLVIDYVSNLANKEKLIHRDWVYQYTAGAGNAPRRAETVAKWANTSDSINATSMYSSVGNWNSGSEVVVLGWDPDDTHTDNFWEQLADVTLSGASSSLDSGTITAKKYLWYQVFIKKNSASNNYAEHSINGITTGNTWARRINSNGGTDGTNTSQNTMNTTDTGAGGYFLNGFVINSSGQEKLFIEHVIQNTSSGVGNAPDRKEIVMKSTTSAQITQLTVTGATNGYDSGSFIKVWGSN